MQDHTFHLKLESNEWLYWEDTFDNTDPVPPKRCPRTMEFEMARKQILEIIKEKKYDCYTLFVWWADGSIKDQGWEKIKGEK